MPFSSAIAASTSLILFWSASSVFGIPVAATSGGTFVSPAHPANSVITVKPH